MSNKKTSLTIFDVIHDYVAVDLETTGLDEEKNEIIEVAAIRVRNGVEVDYFQSLLKIKGNLPSKIVQLTGITRAMLNKAPEPLNVFERLKSFINDDIIISHNTDFDVKFLKNAYSFILKETFTNDHLCTLKFSKMLFPNLKSHKLSNLASYHNIQLDNHHRALDDCRVAYQIYEVCKKTIFDNNIDLDELVKKHFYIHNPTETINRVSSNNYAINALSKQLEIMKQQKEGTGFFRKIFKGKK